MSFTPPVRPRLGRLPFADQEMTWPKFEVFCLDYVSRRSDVKSAYIYGTSGSKQKGIDIVADMKNGERWAFQCRHWKKITGENVGKTVREATFVADHYFILLTSDATTGARDECDLHAKWELWDGRDLSQKVREMDFDEARVLLDTHFGAAVRREFIGMDSLMAFRPASAYFQRFMDASESFNHNWHLVGRSVELKALREFVASPQLICLLPGKGGAGKTKLLQAFSVDFSTHFPDAELRFMSEGIALSALTLDELPLKPCVVVVDDAHRAGDLGPLLELAAQRSTQAAQSSTAIPWLKIVLLCRPFADESLRIRAQNFVKSSDLKIFLELGKLSHTELENLAAQALGPALEIHAIELARLTRDCPLVTTVGGRLLASGAVSIGLLERSEEFRVVVLDRFKEEIIGRVTDGNSEFAAHLLDLISAVAPVRIDDSNFINTMAEFLKVTPAEVMRGLDALETGGVLMRRGDKLRITPDVLSDHILHRACLTSSGQSTTYGESVLEHFTSVCLGEVVRNLAELDWRFHASQGQETQVLDKFWCNWKSDYLSADVPTRGAMLNFMKNLSPSQPRQVLTLVEATFKDTANSEIFYLLPPILRIVAYHPLFTARCLDLLWNLGRDDAREQNQLPDHPMRVLKELASYDMRMGAPSHLNLAAITACEKWLRQADAHDHFHSPLDVVDTLLEKTAVSDFSHSFRFMSRAFVVNPRATAALRVRAIECIKTCVDSEQELLIERAIESCENLAREPIAYFNMTFTSDDLAIWLPEQRRGFELLSEALSNLTTPFGVLKASDFLSWHLEHDPTDELRETALQMFLALPDSFELRLVQCLSWHDRSDYARAHLLLLQSGEELEETEGDNRRYELQLEIENKRFQRCLDEFLTRYPEPDEGMEVLRFYVEESKRRGLRSGWDGASRFVFDVAKRSEDYAVYVAETVLADTQSAFSPVCATILMPLRRSSKERAVDLVRRFSQSPDKVHQHIAASVYSNNAWRDDLDAEDWSILEELSRSAFWPVRFALLKALQWIQTEDKSLTPDDTARALKLLFEMEVAGNVEVANEWAGLFAGYHPTFPLANLTDDQCHLILERLEGVPDIDYHNLKSTLVELSERIATDVVRWLLHRFDYTDPNFKPVPYAHFRGNLGHGPSYDLKGLAKSPDYLDLLREVRSHALGAHGLKSFFLPSLFEMSSLDYGPEGLQVLQEWIDEAERDGDSEKLGGVSLLLRDASRGFAYAQVPFVSRLLSVAQDISDDILQTVKGDIYSSMTSGTIQGTPLQPAPVHVHQREQCLKIAQDLPYGSVEREFYESMSRDAEQMIVHDLKRDEELDDER